jgi:ATP-binding cassette subfamily F protein uup
LDKFLFPRKQQGALIETLSGGEKRRLALVRVLMANPNVLLFDEPTNDFDLETLTALEEYLDNFLGVLIIVSHDRAFLDRTVEFIYAFDGKGNIKQYPGNYSVYLEKKEEEARKAKAAKKDEPKDKNINKPKNTSKKLPYMEQREFDQLEKEIPELEVKKAELEELLASGTLTDYKELEDKAAELKALEEKVDEATMRWLELSEKQE